MFAASALTYGVVSSSPLGGAYDDRVHPRQPQPERDDDRDDADDDADEAVGAFAREEAEVEERVEEQAREEPRHVRHACTTARMSRATGEKSCWSVTRWNSVSSDVAKSRLARAADTTCSATNLSLRQDHRARADLLDHVEAMRAEEDHPALRGEHRDERAEEQARVDVEAGERLVEHEQVGVVQQRRREQHALAHALAERGHRAVARVPQQKQLQELDDLPVERVLRHAAQPADQRQILRCREMRVEVRLFRDVADALLVARPDPPTGSCR